MRASLLRSALPAVLAAGCVAAGTDARGIALDDPLGLVMDVASTGHPLRVYVLPASSYACQAATGTLSPNIPDLPPGMVADAIVDIEADISGDMASAMATVPVGDWTVLVNGKGTDPVSGRRDTIIASGCATVAGLGASESRSVNITLLPIHDMGICMDGTLSPDEQCDPPSMGDCDATCHTSARPVNVRVTGGQTHGRAATATGQRIAVTFDSMRQDVGIRLLDVNGNMVGSTGTSLAQDETIDTLPMPIPQVQGGGRPAMAADGHFAIAMTDFGPAQSDVLVQFFTMDRAPTATTNVLASATGAQRAADAAYAGTGALAVVYENDASATGLSASFFAASSTTVAMGGVAVGSGAGGSQPAIAGTPSGFVVAFTQGGDVKFQRFGADGTPTDAMPVSVLDAADAADTQDQPAVAAGADGSFAIAWTEHNVAGGDGMGTSIRLRTFSAAGMPTGAAVVLPSTGAAGDQDHPAVAAADGRYFVAWASSGSVHARYVSGTGAPLPNREQPQSTNDFVVAAAGNDPSVVPMGASPGVSSWLVVYDTGTNVLSRRYPR